jgi:hypothetical protein
MTFRHKPNTKNDLAYRTALGSMVTAAQTHRDLLVEHGLAVPMLDQLVQLVEQYDAAVTLANEGRAAHVAATLRLERLGTEIVRTVRLMNGRNRQRFQHEAKILGEWISASTVRGTPSRTPDEPETPAPAADAGTPNSGTDVRPAA